MAKILGVRYGEVIYAKEYEYKGYVIKEVERGVSGWTLFRIYPDKEWVPWNLYSLEKAKKLIDKFGDK